MTWRTQIFLHLTLHCTIHLAICNNKSLPSGTFVPNKKFHHSTSHSHWAQCNQATFIVFFIYNTWQAGNGCGHGQVPSVSGLNDQVLITPSTQLCYNSDGHAGTSSSADSCFSHKYTNEQSKLWGYWTTARKLLHDVVKLPALLMCSLAFQYSNPFWIARVTNEGGYAIYASKIGFHCSILWAIRK